MVINCCLVPNAAQIFDEEAERRKRRAKNKAEYVRWKRNKIKSDSKSTSSKSKSSKSSSKKKSKKEKKVAELKKYDNRDELEEIVDLEEVVDLEQMNHKALEVKEPNSESKPLQFERKARPDVRSVFRDPDAISIKSDLQLESLPTSILNESFYSDDSLDIEDLTFEVDYDTSTPLFKSLELNDWGNVLFFLRTGKFFCGGILIDESLDKPDIQVRTWVHSRDDRGDMMWRQLPLHAAICLAAPLVVIQRLVEMYPDALGCPDSFGNLPLNLAAKLHGTQSYIFQIVSLRSHRWLQTRQDSDDEADDSTQGTRELEVAGGPDLLPSFDRPQKPAFFERPLTPTQTMSSNANPSKSRGLEPSGTPAGSPAERLQDSHHDDEMSTDSDEESVETEYTTSEGQDCHTWRHEGSTEVVDSAYVY